MEVVALGTRESRKDCARGTVRGRTPRARQKPRLLEDAMTMFLRDQIWTSGTMSTEFANAALEHLGEALAEASYFDALATYCGF